MTVNQPLLPQEDRIHEHPFSTEFDLPSKAIAADGCCNDQGASSGTYPIAGSVQSSASGLPFVQMILCTLTSSDSNPIPFGTVAYFEPTISECPSGWKAFAEAEGRFLMAGYDEKGVIVSQDLPLASGEDRTHAHPMSVDLSLNEVSYAGRVLISLPPSSGHLFLVTFTYNIIISPN